MRKDINTLSVPGVSQDTEKLTSVSSELFAFRTDANSEIGWGHMMRCLSLADALSDAGQQCIFITSDHVSAELVQNHGYRVFVLDSQWSNCMDQLDKLLEMIHTTGVHRLIVDSYFVSTKYFDALSRIVTVTYIDDEGKEAYSIDQLVNYNISSESVDYHNLYKGKKIELVLGCGYAPIREQFHHVVPKIREDVHTILLSAGATDIHHFKTHFLTWIKPKEIFSRIHWLVLSTAITGEEKRLEDMHKNITLVSSAEDMDKIMLQSDIALSAGGTTLYELCACGVPTISFSFADNQVPNTVCFDQKGIIQYAGDIRDRQSEVFKNIDSFLHELMLDSTLRREKSMRMHMLIDGKGAQRLAKRLISAGE